MSFHCNNTEASSGESGTMRLSPSSTGPSSLRCTWMRQDRDGTAAGVPDVIDSQHLERSRYSRSRRTVAGIR
jgi:hypothetical protein